MNPTRRQKNSLPSTHNTPTKMTYTPKKLAIHIRKFYYVLYWNIVADFDCGSSVISLEKKLETDKTPNYTDIC